MAENETNSIASKLLTKEEFEKFSKEMAESVQTDSVLLPKYNSWHFPFGKRIDLFQKYFGVGGIGLRIEMSVNFIKDKDDKEIIGATAEAKIVNKDGENVVNATRMAMKSDYAGQKDKFVEKSQQYAIETALGYLGIRSSKEDDDNSAVSTGSYSQGAKPNYNNASRPVSAAPTVKPTVPPVAPVKAPTAPTVNAKQETVSEKMDEGVKEVSYTPPVKTEEKSKITFPKEDKDLINEIYSKSKLPPEVSKKYFAIWGGDCKHDLVERFVTIFKSFEEAYNKNPKQAIQELDVLEGRGKMEVNPYNLNIVQKIIS